MIIPTKHENLNRNLLVIGADIIKLLKQNESLTIEEIFQKIKTPNDISLDKLYDSILYLWLLNFILLDNNNLFLVKK